ncbi:MAG TPA: glycoside hydrolase family 2, partial [bacterium]|nr:glycoside hydrolase family 2 [bacterium]
QFESGKVVDFIRGLDPTRLVNQASGWTDRGGGDVVDWHRYPGPASPAPEALRAAVLGEFGGLGLKITGHMWTEENWGYQKMDDMAGLQKRYEQLWMQVWELQEKNGLSAAVYTQTTDVETEANGLMTYDREIIKQDIARAPLLHSGRLPMLPLAR